MLIAQIEEVIMKKIFLAAATLIAVSQAQAGQNYNYSYIQAHGGEDGVEYTGGELDGNSYGLMAQYELDAVPLILKAQIHKGSFDDELANGYDWDFSTYSIGLGYVVSITDRIDLIPGLDVTKIEDEMNFPGMNFENKGTAYTASLAGRYHLEKGLWLGATVAHDSITDEDIEVLNFDRKPHRDWGNQTYFSLEAEYKVDEAWAFGFSRIQKSDESSTRFVVKVFY